MIEASGARTSTARRIPWFQRMSGARIGSSAVNTAPTRPARVQLMKPGACGEEPSKSKTSRSPVLCSASRTS